MIEKYLKNPKKIEYFGEISSTNTVLKQRASCGEESNTILISEYQTQGRGRLGKSFFSPRGCGIYLSYLIKPELQAKDAVFVTVAAAVAMVRAIKKVFLIDTKIKWVNDIYYGNKKLCGILTEGAVSQTGALDYAVLGVGINIKNPPGGYPEEFGYKTTNLEAVNGAVTEDEKHRLVAEFINEFDIIFSDNKSSYIKEYKEASCLIGKNIEILSGEYMGYAEAVDIDDDAGLVVKLPSGDIKTLSSGDVSISMTSPDRKI